MCYKLFDLENIENRELMSKLVFDIATARQLGFALVKFRFLSSKGESFTRMLNTKLRELKKRGKIDIFIFSKDLFSQKTEAEYLLNKFPELRLQNFQEAERAVYVKI